MSIYAITKIELFKLLKKRLTLAMLAILFVPAFYTFSAVTDAPLFQMSPSGALDFAFAQWDLLGMTGLFQVLVSLITVGSFSSEIENGQLRTSVIRLCSRKKIVYAKAISLTFFSILCYFLFAIFSIVCYYIFVIHTPYATGELAGGMIEVLGLDRILIGGLFPFMDVFITMGLVYIFSLKYKSSICFMLAIGISTMFLVLQFFPGVKYLVPAHTNMLLNYAQITSGMAAGLCIVYIATAVICIVIAAKQFERTDLK